MVNTSPAQEIRTPENLREDSEKTYNAFAEQFRVPQEPAAENAETPDNEALRSRYEEVSLLYNMRGQKLDFDDYSKMPERYNRELVEYNQRVEQYLETSRNRIENALEQAVRNSAHEVNSSERTALKNEILQNIYLEFFTGELNNLAQNEIAGSMKRLEHVKNIETSKLTSKEYRAELDMLRGMLSSRYGQKPLELDLNTAGMTLAEYLRQPHIQKEMLGQVMKSEKIQAAALAMDAKAKYETQSAVIGHLNIKKHDKHSFDLLYGFKEDANQTGYAGPVSSVTASVSPIMQFANPHDAQKLIDGATAAADARNADLAEKRELEIALAVKKALKEQKKERSFFKDFLNGFEDRNLAAKAKEQEIRSEYEQKFFILDTQSVLANSDSSAHAAIIARRKEEYLSPQLDNMIDAHAVISGIRRHVSAESRLESDKSVSSSQAQTPLKRVTDELTAGIKFLAGEFENSGRRQQLQEATENIQNLINDANLSPAAKMSALLSAKTDFGMPLNEKEKAFKTAEDRFNAAFGIQTPQNEPLFKEWEYKKSRENYFLAQRPAAEQASQQNANASPAADHAITSFWQRLRSRFAKNENVWHKDKAIYYSGVEIRKVEGSENVYEARRLDSEGKSYLPMGQYTIEQKTKGVKKLVAHDQAARDYENNQTALIRQINAAKTTPEHKAITPATIQNGRLVSQMQAVRTGRRA